MRHCGIPAFRQRREEHKTFRALRQCGIAAMRHCGNAAEKREGKSFLHSVIAALRHSGRKKRSNSFWCCGTAALRHCGITAQKKRRQTHSGFAALRHCGREKGNHSLIPSIRHYGILAEKTEETTFFWHSGITAEKRAGKRSVRCSVKVILLYVP